VNKETIEEINIDINNDEEAKKAESLKTVVKIEWNRCSSET